MFFLSAFTNNGAPEHHANLCSCATVLVIELFYVPNIIKTVPQILWSDILEARDSLLIYMYINTYKTEERVGGGGGLVCRVVQFSSVTQLCPNLCHHMDYSTPGLPVDHQLLSLFKLMLIELVIPSNHLILCRLLLLLFAMKWWDQMPWSSFSECWALNQLLTLLFHQETV